jgi:hypothetical protein
MKQVIDNTKMESFNSRYAVGIRRFGGVITTKAALPYMPPYVPFVPMSFEKSLTKESSHHIAT